MKIKMPIPSIEENFYLTRNGAKVDAFCQDGNTVWVIDVDYLPMPSSVAQAKYQKPKQVIIDSACTGKDEEGKPKVIGFNVILTFNHDHYTDYYDAENHRFFPSEKDALDYLKRYHQGLIEKRSKQLGVIYSKQQEQIKETILEISLLNEMKKLELPPIFNDKINYA
jgi:hypothetical protein